MLYSKFIIEENNLILAKCTFHKQLATDITKVKGGGMFRYDEDKKAFILNGSSYDFGASKIEDIRKCIELGNVYGNSRLSRKLNDYKFLYDTQTELIELN